MENTSEIKRNFVIPLVLGEETRPKIELFDNKEYSVKIKNSIFYQQYCIALSGIAELVTYNNEYMPEDKQNDHNNIFVFTGDRGSGKTSCMLTVRELLCNNRNKKERYSNLEIDSSLEKILVDTSFQEIDLIDPIFFDDKHNILELFIGILFKTVQELEEKTGAPFYSDQQKEMKRDRLLNNFSETKRNLSVLNKTSTLSEFDDLEQLKDLAASVNFRNSLRRLVDSYIDYMYDRKHQLILCIDDIDLNMSEGYVMIEQIRKFLNIPGLIILMALRMEQLANVIRIKYANDFEPLLKLENTSKYNEVINGMVERYITKLFPQSQRIQLPTVSYLLNQSIGVFQYERTKNLVFVEVLDSLKGGLLQLIYKKIRLLAYNTSQQVNYIIPRNLRELLNLVHLLYSMKNAANHKEAIPNLLRFKDYFYNGWCANNLDGEGLFFMRSTLIITNPDVINQMVVRSLKERFRELTKLEKMKEEKDSSIKELVNILDEGNIMYNISLGDVLACLDWMDKLCNEEKDLKFLYAIKLFYSICLYENFRNKEEVMEEVEKTKKEIVNRERLTNNETSYGNIVNGNFFNSEYLNVAPYEKGDISRCRRMVSRSQIEELWNNGKKELAEFFMLTTSFVIESREYEKDNRNKENNAAFASYRKRRAVYYEKGIASGRQNVCFDVLSIFYNLLDVRKTYDRYSFFGKDDCVPKTLNKKELNSIKKWIKNKYEGREETEIVKKIKEVENAEAQLLTFIERCPLYKRILDSVRLEGDDVLYYQKEKKLLYTLNIRNVEILEQISYSLQRNRPDGSTDNISLLKKMFTTLSKYEIQTYVGYNISFGFLNAICEFLGELSQNDNDKALFLNVYSDDSSAKSNS